MAEEFTLHIKTSAGVHAPLRTTAQAQRISNFGRQYARLKPGDPFMVIRHIPDANSYVVVMMTLAAKPVASVLQGAQMLTQRGFEFPVKRHAESDGGEITLVEGSLVIAPEDLADTSTRAYFGERSIMDWIFRNPAPPDPHWRDLEERLHLLLREMAGMVGTALLAPR